MDPNDPDDAQPHSAGLPPIRKNGKDWLALGRTDLAIQLFRKSPLPSFPPSGRQMSPDCRYLWKVWKICGKIGNKHKVPKSKTPGRTL